MNGTLVKVVGANRVQNLWQEELHFLHTDKENSICVGGRKKTLCAFSLNLQTRCHPLNILLAHISSSFSATQIPSFLQTHTLLSSLTHTHTGARTSFKHADILAASLPALFL